MFPAPLHLTAWLAGVRSSLVPPVGNAMVPVQPPPAAAPPASAASAAFAAAPTAASSVRLRHTCMAVAGPNARSDFHVEAGEELFLQLEGTLTLRVMEGGAVRDVAVPPGHLLALPARVPHSPQRPPGSLGIVWERTRRATERDALRWYARDGSGRTLYEEWFYCADLGTQLPPVIARFLASRACADGMPDAAAPLPLPPPMLDDTEARVPPPVDLRAWLDGSAKPAGGAVMSGLPGEYRVEAVCGAGGGGWHEWCRVAAGDAFLYALDGSAALVLRRIADGVEQTCALPSETLIVVPGGGVFDARLDFARADGGGAAVLVITNAALDEGAGAASLT